MTKTKEEKFVIGFGVFCLFSVFIIMMRLSYIAGMQSEGFDRYHANRKLEDCQSMVGQ